MTDQSSVMLDAGQRLRRLLAVLVYLAHAGEARIDDLAHRFELDRKTLVRELELAACCGLPPYTPDQLLELVIDDERVFAYGLDALAHPPRLTPDEGFAVAAAARALVSLGDDSKEAPLVRALAKLERALGDNLVLVELDRPVHFPVLHRAASDGELVEIDYLGSRRGEETTRLVMAYAVVAREGHFYLDAYCHMANDWRRFQLDRITAVRPTGRVDEPRTPPASFGGVRAFTGGDDTTLVHIALAAERSFLIERFTTGPARKDDRGRIVVAVEVGEADFLGRLLLRLGEEAEVLDPPRLVNARSEVARRALARYEQDD